MRTNIVLDDDLVKEAFHYAKVKTKKELIDTVLREFVANHKKVDLRKLKGKVEFLDDYDYKKMRSKDV
jgi:Arc/MetJ family transcription regulator